MQLEGEQVIKEINNSKPMTCCQADFRNAFLFIQSTRNSCSVYLPWEGTGLLRGAAVGY